MHVSRSVWRQMFVVAGCVGLEVASATSPVELWITTAPMPTADSAVDCRAYVRFDDGRQMEVSLATAWTVTPSAAASIGATGRLAASPARAQNGVHVEAAFAWEGRVETASTMVDLPAAAFVPAPDGQTAIAGDPELVGLRIDGPDEVPESTVTPYRVYAEFSDGREFEVTLFSDLSVDPGEYASINQFGDFDALDVPGDQKEAIQARFEFGGVEKTAERVVTIIDVSLAGHALDFDGQNDFVFVEDAPSLRLTGSLTIEAWVRLPNPLRTGVVLWRGDKRPLLDPYSIRLSNGNVILRIDDNQTIAEARADLRPYEWEFYHHIAGVFDDESDQLILYIDGERKAVAETQLSPVPNQEGMWLTIGALDDNGSTAVEGEIDEVRLWNVPRTPADIRCDMNRLLRGDEEGLVGYWRFDDARGQAARDSSPYGNDGVLGLNAEPEGDPSDPAWVLSEADINEPPLDPPLWGEPTLIPYLSTGEDWEITVAMDDLSLYMSSERAGFAVVDIYYSERDSLNEPFSTPQLVPELSRPGYNNSDITPVLSANQLRMYLSQGVGQSGYDLYVAERPSKDARWNSPQRITTLNSPANETMVAVSHDDKFIVFMSARGGRPELWTSRRDSPDADWEAPTLFEELKDFRQGRGFYNFGGAFSRDDLTFYVAATPPGESMVSYWRMSRRSRNAPFDPPTRIEELGTSTGKTSMSITGDDQTMYLILISGGGLHGRVFVSKRQERPFCPPHCDQITRLRAKCRAKTLKITIMSGLVEVSQMTIDNNGAQQVVTTNGKGKARAKWDNQTGIHTVFIMECPEFVEAVNCGT
ncbi:MAG: hypothetical protein C4547_04410 [Phycisphaerales bacterium]|nr:MAG: hypothetical protein C4547_04410 [Phycisphaerales bacterium]